MQTRTTIVAVAAVLALAVAGMADTHAPWPADWNNWTDPALWAAVGDPGNGVDARYAAPGSPYYGNGTGFGAVSYEYKIGTFEVTAGQYTAFLNAVAATDTYALYNPNMGSSSYSCKIQRTGSSGIYTYSVASDYTNRPVNYVSWGDAARFANWVTRGQPSGAQDLSTTEDGSYYLNGATSAAALLAVTRKPDAKYVIPTEDEWYKAAYYDANKLGGAGYWDYPTGSNTAPSNIVTNPDPGNNANFWGDGTGGYSIGGPYYRTPVGEFENSDSPYGTFDQGGNVWEWNEAIISSFRGLRGGSFSDIGGYYLRAAGRNYLGPAYEDYWIGFRVVQVPEPATLSLLALGGLAVMRRSRK